MKICHFLFNSHFVLRRQQFFYSKKIRLMKAGQNNKFDITKDFRSILCTFVSALYISFAPHFHAHLFVTGQNLVKTHLERQLD